MKNEMITETKPKILFIDIETSPNLAWVWGKWEQNVIDFQSEWHILSFVAKWIGGEPIVKGLIDYPNYARNKENDRELVKDIWKLLDEADVVIAHNGDEFDIKKINARFSFYKMTPPSPYKTVDTKKIAKKYFAFNSNSLDDLGEHLGLGRKVKHDGFEMWKGCMDGDRKYWDMMLKYNVQDVALLERVYLRFLPWMVSHPNLGMFTDKIVCARCGSNKLQSRGMYRNKTTEYRRVYCSSCGGWGRASDNLREERPIIAI